jgi:antitoxin MazE
VEDPVELREESGRIVIEPMRHKDFDLAELLDGIARKKVHRETDAGAPAGSEVW